jgi:hypothetical protein
VFLTKQAIEHFRQTIEVRKLEENEVRRIVGMGETYVSEVGAVVGSEYVRLYDLNIDGIGYSVYVRYRH